MSAYVLLPETMNEALFFAIGPSSVSRLLMDPIPPVAENFFEFPSFILTSSNEEIRPPDQAGISPL